MKLSDLKPRVVRLLGMDIDEKNTAQCRSWRERNRERSRQIAREGYHRRKALKQQETA